MGIKAKLIGQITFKAGGDVFHDIFKQRPHQISTMTPGNIQGFTLLEGELGTPGSIISWNYTHNGKSSFVKELIEVVDDEKKSIVFKIIEGDPLEHYKNLTATYHVDTIGADSLITWTLDYEKLNVDSSHPGTLLNILLQMVEDFEYHHQEKPKTSEH